MSQITRMRIEYHNLARRFSTELSAIIVETEFDVFQKWWEVVGVKDGEESSLGDPCDYQQSVLPNHSTSINISPKGQNWKQLLDEVFFLISRIIKVEARAKPRAGADNSYRGLYYSGYHKN